jgi:hypothetical protein
MANTTWSTTDRLNVTLSGTNNLTVSAATAAGGVRTLDRNITGKFYFEYTHTTWIASAGAGLANAAAVLSTNAASGVNSTITNINGAITVNNATSLGSIGARTNGDVTGIALDLTNNLIWFRVAPSGNWNGSAAANPATGVGGFSIAPIAGARPLYGWVGTTAAATFSVTANFGDTAFVGAVPAGFTSGFTSGATPPTYEIGTQFVVDQWGTNPTPTANLTQIAVDQWIGPLATGVNVQLTQMIIEQWSLVPSLSTQVWLTQASFEHWYTPSVRSVQLTQAALEQWGGSSSTLNVWLTQTALEQWGPIITVTFEMMTQAALEHWTTPVRRDIRMTQASLEHWVSLALPPVGDGWLWVCTE